MAILGRQQYFADGTSLQKDSREFSIADEVQQKIDSVEEGAQVNVIETVKVNGTALEPDQDKAVNISVPDVIDNLSSTSTTDALSAKQGKVLYDSIQSISARGRFLSNWNCATGLATTNPPESPYTYNAGDYFIVSNVAAVGGTNYRPSGSTYVIGQASTAVESESVSVSSMYVYDGTNWVLTSGAVSIAIDTSLSDSSTNPVENRVITNALNGKAPVADTNTKTFYLSSTSDLTNAQAALDWYLAGKNPLIDLNGRTWTVVGYRAEGTPKTLDFQSPQLPIQTNAYSPSVGQKTDILSYTLVLSSNASDVVTSVYIVNGTVVTSFLDTSTNYTYPYIPQYDGSPATKKYVDDKSTVISASIPSNPTEGMRWYNTTDDVLEVYDGTAWNPLLTYAGLEDSIEAGSNISIDEVCELDTRGPCPEGFHVPTPSEWESTRTMWTALGGSGGTNYSIALKMPFYGRRSYSSSIQSRDSYGYYWTCVANSTTDGYRHCFIVYSGSAWVSTTNRASEGNSIRPFKNEPVIPDNTWTKLYGTSIEAGGIFWSATEGLISLSSNGTTWVTIADKNLGATTVWNNGDTLTETNSGKFYQWGNNYGFPGDGNIPSSGQSYSTVDASSYGPGNYYSGSKFIYVSNGRWDSSNNKNLWGGATQGNICKLQISAASGTQWGNITGTLSQQTDLQNALDGKVNVGLTKVFDSTTVEIGKWVDEGGMQSSGHHVTIDPNGEVSTYNVTVGGHNEATLGSANLTLLENTVLGGDETTVITQDGITITEGNTTKTYDFLGNDRIATLSDVSGSTGGIVDDTAYGASWDGVTTIAPSKNVVYDKLESMSAGIPVVASTAPSSATEGMIWYDSTNDVLKTYDGTNWSEAGTKMVVLEYGVSTWQDFLDAYNKNALVYCKVSSGSSGYRMAFMAYTAGSSTPTEVEFQYYRSRSSHSTAANQLDEVYVYKLTNAGVWTTTQRDTAAKAIAGTGIGLSFNSSGMTISNTLPGATVASTQPSSSSEGDLWYDTTNDVLKAYDGTNWVEVGNDSADINTKAFYLSSNSDLTNAQAAYDWWLSGKTAIVYVGSIGPLFAVSGQSSQTTSLLWEGACENIGEVTAGSVSTIKKPSAYFEILSGDVVTVSSSSVSAISGGFLSTDINYSTPYTPAYNGSPATKKYVDDSVSSAMSSGTTAPSNPVEGQLWYDTTNDVLKVYDGTNWVKVGDDSAAINTKTFYLSNTSDLTTAQAAYDWYAAGKNPIIYYDNNTYVIISANSSSIYFGTPILKGGSNSYSATYQCGIKCILFSLSSGTVTTVSANSSYAPVGGAKEFLALHQNYSTPYTPEYDGSPATKKYVDDRDTYIGSSAPTSNLVEGRLRYDTTNDQLKVYDGTNWNVTGKEYNAGEGIEIINGADYGAMRGPVQRGFHIPSSGELSNLNGLMYTLIGATAGSDYKSYLHMPLAGRRGGAGVGSAAPDSQGSIGLYQTNNTPNSFGYALYMTSSSADVDQYAYHHLAISIRAFKDTPVVPDNTWTPEYQPSRATGQDVVGIYHNSTLGLISISGDGITWVTIADKNIGATVVYNDGDTLSEANCGKYFQRGNCYGFPFDSSASITTTTTQVDASGYGPGNYYYSDEFFVVPTNSGPFDWMSTVNYNLWGAQTGVITRTNAITNTGVTSVNGQSGDVTINLEIGLSAQANNILTSGAKIWAGTQTNYENLGTYDSNTVYLTIE